MKESEYPRAYFYKRIVAAKLFIDEYYANDIDIENIAGEGFFQNLIS